MRPEPVLVTGATGYVGGRLIPQLLNAGWRVRAQGRSAAKFQGRPWAGHPNVELAAGDVLDLESLNRAAATPPTCEWGTQWTSGGCCGWSRPGGCNYWRR